MADEITPPPLPPPQAEAETAAGAPKKPWTKPIVRIIAKDGALLTKGGPKSGTTENSGYFFSL